MLGRPWPQPGRPLFTPEDAAWAIALHELEQEEAAENCPLCGLPKSICRAAENQGRFRAEAEYCHASYAILAAQTQHEGGSEASRRAISWTAHLKSRPT